MIASRRSSLCRAVRLIPLTSLMTACTLLTATPPSVQVVGVELRSADLLEQQLGVTLCVTNPNDSALAFRQVRVAIDIAGAPLANSTSETPVTLPPHASVLIPFAVALTPRNLGSQLLGLVSSGTLEYRLHGSVQLTGSLGITLPFSRAGRLDLASSGAGLLADAATLPENRCQDRR